MMNASAIMAGIVFLSFAWASAQDSRPAVQIDWQKAQSLNQRATRGEQLMPDEKEYLDKAKAEIAAGRGPGRSTTASRPGQGPASRQGQGPAGRPAGAATNPADLTVPPAHDKLGLLPLDQMTAQDSYKGQDGGLYGEGRNDPPAGQLKAAKAALAKVQPLDKDGKRAADGKIVLMSVGMSNTMGEFGQFKRDADGDKDKSPAVVAVNGAIGGMTAQEWTKPDSQVWQEVQRRLSDAKVADKQVQVVWLKQAIGGPGRLGDFQSSAGKLKEFLIGDIQQILSHYPNVRVIYLSSRIYAGNATSALNPEPYAYESAFAVRWVIQDQVKGVAELNFDPAKGDVKAPVLLWGPYLWADGVTPRKSDGLSYLPSDFNADGTHPGPSGGAKVARLLAKFFKNDLNAPWYVKAGAAATPAK